MKGHQAQNGNSDCDGRNQNPSPPLPILHHPDTILAFSIQILAMRDGRISALEPGQSHLGRRPACVVNSAMEAHLQSSCAGAPLRPLHKISSKQRTIIPWDAFALANPRSPIFPLPGRCLPEN
jgi:hypothetical protein